MKSQKFCCELNVRYESMIDDLQDRVKELEQERDEAVRQWERFERMAGDNWAALKAQAGEPVGYHFSYTTPFGHVVWDIDYTPRPDAIECYPLVRAHPTTEHPYNPLNDYAVISMNPTEPVKAQAGEPPRVDPNWVNIKMDVSNPTTERRVIPEELITRIKQTANRWANRSYDCGNRDGMGYQSSTPAKLMDQSRDDFNELIEELRNALNAAPAKGEV